jgi:hypothetical protein
VNFKLHHYRSMRISDNRQPTGVDFYAHNQKRRAATPVSKVTSAARYSRGSMTDDIDNRLRQLCDLAKVEQDRDKIKLLAQEIARLLVEKLKRQPPDRKAG